MARIVVTPKILLVSNLQTTLPLWVFNSLQSRLQVILEPQPGNVWQCWRQENPAIVIFDIAPPESLAIDLIRELRTEAIIPILLLTSNQTDKLLLDAYEAGVDECILKPIPPSLFHAKLRAWLRRSGSLPDHLLDSLKVGRVQFMPMNRMIIIDNQSPIHLTNLEVQLMSYLMQRPGRTVTIEKLCQHMWRDGRETNKAMLKNVVYRLRRKIATDLTRPHCIETVAGIGYQFVPD